MQHVKFLLTLYIFPAYTDEKQIIKPYTLLDKQIFYLEYRPKTTEIFFLTNIFSILRN